LLIFKIYRIHLPFPQAILATFIKILRIVTKEFYVQLYSPHGLIRHEEPEIGRDKDTGGQVKYVLELLQSLSEHPAIRKVDLFTRRISDKRVSSTYSQEIEIVNEKARIVRINCGGNAYKPKETLWEHLDEFVDKTVRFIVQQRDVPDVVHGHYADGIYLAGEISAIFGIPLLATGHSLGRNKKKLLLADGVSEEVIEEKYNMKRRIQEEEKALAVADLFVVSTQYIIDSQYSDYEHYKEASFKVISPGINREVYFPFYRMDMPSYKMPVEQEQTLYRVNSDIERFLFNPDKPLILSIGRADKRKNFEIIIQSYGEDKELQAMANLAIFAGVRKDITKMGDEEKDTLTNLLLLLDKFDLYGKMAIPKKNDPKRDVPEIYRLAARKRGVFVNATPSENFGLTIVEAAACGLPVIASPTGGPKEILEQNDNGILVDVDDPHAIAAAIKMIIADQSLWNKYSSNGILASDQRYSWSSFANEYMQAVEQLLTPSAKSPHRRRAIGYGKKLLSAEYYVITDLDGTLLEGADTRGLDELCAWLSSHAESVAFGIASGRTKEITLQAIRKHRLPQPDVLICSAGSEIYYGQQLIPDKGWGDHINYQWKREEIQQRLARFPGIRLQEPDAQWPFKLSYYVDDFTPDDMADLHKFLDDHRLKSKVLLTDNKFLDILPTRASKGSAVNYLGYKWNHPPSHIITAGNGGNDIDMLKSKARAIVVSNHSPELEELKRNKAIYFSKLPLSLGVLDGIQFHIRSMKKESRA
jgi:sucrose-phosphate synthase